MAPNIPKFEPLMVCTKCERNGKTCNGPRKAAEKPTKQPCSECLADGLTFDQCIRGKIWSDVVEFDNIIPDLVPRSMYVETRKLFKQYGPAYDFLGYQMVSLVHLKKATGERSAGMSDDRKDHLEQAKHFNANSTILAINASQIMTDDLAGPFFLWVWIFQIYQIEMLHYSITTLLESTTKLFWNSVRIGKPVVSRLPYLQSHARFGFLFPLKNTAGELRDDELESKTWVKAFFDLTDNTTFANKTIDEQGAIQDDAKDCMVSVTRTMFSIYTTNRPGRDPANQDTRPILFWMISSHTSAEFREAMTSNRPMWLSILGTFALASEYISVWWLAGLSKKILQEIEKKENEMGNLPGWKNSLKLAMVKGLGRNDW